MRIFLLAMLLPMASGAALIPAAAQAATLKPYTALEGSVVRLSDLFDGADARPLGPSPAPGARITVEAPQLTAIAHMFGVDWRAAGPGDRAVLERPGRSLSRDDVLGPLRTMLQDAGAPRDSEIEFSMPSSAPLPAGAAPSLEFGGMEYSSSNGRFTTLLTVGAEGVAPVQLRLSGHVQEMVELPVPRRAMFPGDIVMAADLQWTRLRIGLARTDVLRVPAQAVGQALRRSVQPGQPITLADLGRPLVVLKGAPLALTLESPGLAVTAQGVATEPGGVGDRIHVSNPFSRAIVEAEITGPGRARVTPAEPTSLPQKVAVR